jgi:formate dehydrogenase iron-sulfur subunit
VSIGILVDVTKCTGCEACAEACVAANTLSPADAATARATTRDGLSAGRYLAVPPVGGKRYARKACMHCLEPSCVSACLVGGIRKTPEGPVVYDATKCIGCRYCMLACPFHIPRYEWEQPVPYMRKCDLCAGRVREGRSPACVEACPREVLQFGERDALLREAKKRITQGAGRYLPHIWGEREWGGTSVLYISDVDLTPAGWTGAAATPIPSITEPLVRKTPFIGLAVALGSCALSAIIGRRNRVRAGAEAHPGAPTPSAKKEDRGD